MADKYAADLPPHPLFTGLTIALSDEALRSAAEELGVEPEKRRKSRRSVAKHVAAVSAHTAREDMAAQHGHGSKAPQYQAPADDEASPEGETPPDPERRPDPESPTEPERRPGNESSGNPIDVPVLSTFAGYLGDAIEYRDRNWRVLYLDTKLSSWLLVEEQAIVFHDRMHDRTAAYGMRDVIWLNAEATVGRGIGPQAGEARFLRGAFTSAGDVTAAVTGGTFDAATGIFCEAQTPGCCGWPTHH
jgi:hypothetical protein